MDVLAWNRAAAALLTDFGALPSAERNLIRPTFLDAPFRALYADWPRAARECVGVLRMETGRSPHDPAPAALVGELRLREPDFRTWWAGHQVRGPRQLTKTYLHPVVGEMTLDVQQFTVDTHPSSSSSPTPRHPTRPPTRRSAFSCAGRAGAPRGPTILGSGSGEQYGERRLEPCRERYADGSAWPEMVCG